MMAEKAADIILGREPLPQENPDIWIHPEWQQKQR
jgi:choline dehydrogenase